MAAAEHAHLRTSEPGLISGSDVQQKNHWTFDVDPEPIETTQLLLQTQSEGLCCELLDGSWTGDASAQMMYVCRSLCTRKDNSSIYKCTSGGVDCADVWVSARMAGKSTLLTLLSNDVPDVATAQKNGMLAMDWSVGGQAQPCQGCSSLTYGLLNTVDGVDGARNQQPLPGDTSAQQPLPGDTSAQHDRNHSYLSMPSPEGQTFATVCSTLASEVSQCPACSKRALHLLGRAS